MRSLRRLAVAVLTVILALSAGIGLVPSHAAEQCQPVELPLGFCVVQLGVKANGTVTWLPTYASMGTPISQCQNKTNELGEDALGRTILTHEYTHYHICTATGTTTTTTATATIETTTATATIETTATTTLTSSTIPEFRSVFLTMVVAFLVIAILRRR